MASRTNFTLTIIKDLARKFGLPQNQLKAAISEGERVWISTRKSNQEDQVVLTIGRKRLRQMKDYQRGKQKSLSEEARLQIEWTQRYTGGGRLTEDQAIQEIADIFSRPRGQPQVDRYHKGVDLLALRCFSIPLTELWTSLRKSWTVSSNDETRKDRYSPAERFLFACARHLEPNLSRANVRRVIQHPETTKEEFIDDSEYMDMVMVLTKDGPVIKKYVKK